MVFLYETACKCYPVQSRMNTPHQPPGYGCPANDTVYYTALLPGYHNKPNRALGGQRGAHKQCHMDALLGVADVPGALLIRGQTWIQLKKRLQ